MRPRTLILVLTAVVVLTAFLAFLFKGRQSVIPPSLPGVSDAAISTPSGNTPSLAPTEISAHNLLLRKGPSFRIYVRWLLGQMTRTRRNVNPSFDDPESFVLNISTGVVRANIGDIANFLNTGMSNAPLKNIVLSGDGHEMKLRGTLHKGISFPIELTGTISAIPDGRIQIHVTKLNVLKIPFKALLGGFHIKMADLFHPAGMEGVTVSENDIVLDPQRLLPPPHIRGQLTDVRVANPDLEEIYGNAGPEVTRVAQWRNYLRLRDGTIDFGKLTMHHVDLIMVDISNNYWFDLDLAHYQDQLVNGYTRMTPQAGLQIFMPDLATMPKKVNTSVSMEWLKHRNAPPPPDITSK